MAVREWLPVVMAAGSPGGARLSFGAAPAAHAVRGAPRAPR